MRNVTIKEVKEVTTIEELADLNLVFNLTQKMDSYNTYYDLCSCMSKAKALKRMKDSLINDIRYFKIIYK